MSAWLIEKSELLITVDRLNAENRELVALLNARPARAELCAEHRAILAGIQRRRADVT